MNEILTSIKNNVYDNCSLTISKFLIEKEGKEYQACQFKINGLHIICRNAKVTPKKAGQFVTFWKRIGCSEIEPFNESDLIDYYVVNVQTENNIGQFVFPKSILIEKRIISTDLKEGKRAFRVYPPWDIAKNTQALNTQTWQLNYFYNINDTLDFKHVIHLYNSK